MLIELNIISINMHHIYIHSISSEVLYHNIHLNGDSKESVNLLMFSQFKIPVK